MINQPSSPPDSPPPPPPAPWFHFGEPASPATRSVVPEHVATTPNNEFDAVIFDDLLADLSTKDAPLSAVTSVSIQIPAEVLSNDPFLGYKVDFRGTCIKSTGSRAVLLAEVGGTTHATLFRYDEERSADNPGWQAVVFSFEQRPNKDSGLPVVPLPPFTINVMISVQRRTTDEFVTMTLDSIDITAVRL